MTISVIFFTSYIYIFYKTKVQTVILSCLTSLNLNWVKTYYINHKKCVFQFWKKKPWKFKFQKWPFLEHLWSFLGIYIDIFCRTEVQTVILRFLVCLNLNWINTYFGIFGQKHFFFLSLKFINLWVKYRSKFWYLKRKSSVMQGDL